MGQIFDLFGDPVPDNWGGRGRPQHIATHENCNKVNMLLAFGWNNERISKALGITPPTLRKNYFRELKFREEKRDKIDARLAMLLWEQCAAGNVAAMKEFRKLQERNDLMGAQEDFNSYRKREPTADDAPKLGKKEQQALAAANAGDDSDWDDDLKVEAPSTVN